MDLRRWEYTVLVIHIGSDTVTWIGESGEEVVVGGIAQLVKVLNEFGRQRWQLQSTIPQNSQYTMVLSRELNSKKEEVEDVRSRPRSSPI